MAVREWLGGLRGVCVPPLGSRLPYQLPTLCSLRALSGLLLHKKALEHRASSLGPSGAAGALQASLGCVRRQLQDSPAYLLLKARFLAAFTLPALLATLSPPGVPTTLSAAVRADPESEGEELELISDQSPQAGPAATAPVQVGGPGHSACPIFLHPPQWPRLPVCGLPGVVGWGLGTRAGGSGGPGGEPVSQEGKQTACKLCAEVPLATAAMERRNLASDVGRLSPLLGLPAPHHV